VYIYIDESGPFAVPQGGGSSVCCVAALTIPESIHASVLEGFGRIVQGWGPGPAEPKGRLLNERRIDRLITYLGNFDVVLTLVAIDLGLHSDAVIRQHKLAQSAAIRHSADGPEHFQSLRDSLDVEATRLESIANPLYVQSFVLTELVELAVQTTTLHYAQTEPSALGSFRWRIDAKDKRRTEYEDLWQGLILPMLQSASLRRGLITIEGFDYSAMEWFSNPVEPDAPPHLRHDRVRQGEEFHSFDARKLMGDLAFVDSHLEPGLQLVDILASAYRRAFNGTLRERGWRRLGKLLIRDIRSGHAPEYVTLHPRTVRPMRVGAMPYGIIARQMDRDARAWEVSARRPG